MFWSAMILINCSNLLAGMTLLFPIRHAQTVCGLTPSRAAICGPVALYLVMILTSSQVRSVIEMLPANVLDMPSVCGWFPG